MVIHIVSEPPLLGLKKELPCAGPRCSSSTCLGRKGIKRANTVMLWLRRCRPIASTFASVYFLSFLLKIALSN